jgi:toxin FitB
MFLVDTNVVSELRKVASGRAHPNVTTWAQRVPSSMLHLSTLSLFELELGVLLAERKDPFKGGLLRGWLEKQVVPSFGDRIIPLGALAAVAAAGLHVPATAAFRDAFIGATAIVHGLTLVTRNTKDFARFPGLVLLNPWT